MRRSDKIRGFTLVELMVAAAIFAVLLGLLFTVISQFTQIWQQGDRQKSRRQAARAVMEIMTRDLESAQFPAGGTNASQGLQFLLNPPAAPANRDAAFWQAAVPGTSASGDMYEIGYFVQWGEDRNGRPRSALCRYSASATNENTIFNQPDADWITPGKLKAYAPGLDDLSDFKGVLAEDVIGLWITLYDAQGKTNGLGPNYHSLSNAIRPAAAEIALVLLDRSTAERIESPDAITGLYTDTPERFVEKLPEAIRPGAQIFRARVRLETSR